MRNLKITCNKLNELHLRNFKDEISKRICSYHIDYKCNKFIRENEFFTFVKCDFCDENKGCECKLMICKDHLNQCDSCLNIDLKCNIIESEGGNSSYYNCINCKYECIDCDKKLFPNQSHKILYYNTDVKDNKFIFCEPCFIEEIRSLEKWELKYIKIIK